jgi:hypothetical protein
MFLSTLFGMGLALILEYLDDTIRTTEEIETYLQLPALAAIRRSIRYRNVNCCLWDQATRRSRTRRIPNF